MGKASQGNDGKLARPYQIYEKVRAAMEAQLADGKNNGRHIRHRTAKRPAVRKTATKCETEQDNAGDFNFEELYLTRRKLFKFLRTKDIPPAPVKKLISAGRLCAKTFDGYKYEKYSTRQLGVLLRESNRA